MFIGGSGTVVNTAYDFGPIHQSDGKWAHWEFQKKEDFP